MWEDTWGRRQGTRHLSQPNVWRKSFQGMVELHTLGEGKAVSTEEFTGAFLANQISCWDTDFFCEWYSGIL